MSPAPSTLSEYASKRLLADFGVPCNREALVAAPAETAGAAAEIGFPVALKLCGAGIAHKTERDLVRLGLADADAVARAAQELWGRRRPEDGDVGLLVAEMVEGRRELIAGLVRDPQLGPCVMLGLGGILAEALGDVVFASVPLSPDDALVLPERLATAHLLTQPFRGDPPVDREALARVLLGLSRLAEARPDVVSVDLNPLVVRGAEPLPVDALVELGDATPAAAPPELAKDEALRQRFEPLFHPRGIIVAGASTHPAKFGFVTVHNLLRFGYEGEIFAINRDGADVLGRPTLRDIEEVPSGRADLIFVCTPNAVNVPLIQAAARKGVRAAFVASGGYREAGGRRARCSRTSWWPLPTRRAYCWRVPTGRG